ncbi:MAG: hypothetical protein ABIQ16_16300 [Polyangiaceae bacterium]
MTTAQLVLQAGGATDVGKRRSHNEDAVLTREDLSLYLVADGAGGHNAGEVASALCARSMSNYFGASDGLLKALGDLVVGPGRK